MLASVERPQLARAASSDSPCEFSGPIQAAGASDTSAAGGQLDFSGSSFFFPENSVGSAPEPMFAAYAPGEALSLTALVVAQRVARGTLGHPLASMAQRFRPGAFLGAGPVIAG